MKMFAIQFLATNFWMKKFVVRPHQNDFSKISVFLDRPHIHRINFNFQLKMKNVQSSRIINFKGCREAITTAFYQNQTALY